MQIGPFFRQLNKKRLFDQMKRNVKTCDVSLQPLKDANNSTPIQKSNGQSPSTSSKVSLSAQKSNSFNESLVYKRKREIFAFNAQIYRHKNGKVQIGTLSPPKREFKRDRGTKRGYADMLDLCRQRSQEEANITPKMFVKRPYNSMGFLSPADKVRFFSSHKNVLIPHN
jgi:hypothetical protein